MKIDQFENARKTRKKAQQTFFSSTKKFGDENYREKWKKQNKKKKRSGKNYVRSFPKPRMPHRIQFKEKFKTKDVGIKEQIEPFLYTCEGSKYRIYSLGFDLSLI
jgi:hypothetical protein